MLAIRLSAPSLFVILLLGAAAAQNPPQPQPTRPQTTPPQTTPPQATPPQTTPPGGAAPATPVGPPVAAEAQKTGLPEERAEFDYKATGTEHPYVDMAGLVARDPRTGDLGVILLSSSPGAGAFCVEAKAEAGIAVVSGNADAMWPAQAIELLGKRLAPADVVARLKADTTQSVRERQELVVLAADGRGASHIGETVFGFGKTTEVAEQQDWIAFTTWAATPGLMVGLKKEFPATQGLPLPERLIMTLQRALDPLPVDKGKRADLSGRPVAAALIIVRKDGGRLGRGDRLVDLRVDYDQEPLARLRGLYRVWAQAHLGPALRASLTRINDQQSEAYRADQEWMHRLRARVKIGDKR